MRTPVTVGAEARGSGRTAYLAGLATNLGNPKAGVSAISLLPAFAGIGFLPTHGFGIVWATVTACWYLLFRSARLPRPDVHDTTWRPTGPRAVSGFVLVAVGIGVAAGG